MNLKVLLPFRVLIEKENVSRLVLETQAGSLGVLPQRLDCVAALVPGIMVFETEPDGERYLAVDEGVMVKTGSQVLVSVRHAIEGHDLHQLRATVEKDFLELDAQAKEARALLTKLESRFINRIKGTSTYE